MLGLPVNDKLKIIHYWIDEWKALDYYLEKNPKTKVIILDTWGRFVSRVCKSGNDYAETTALASHLHDLAKKHKAAIIAVTHTRKGASAKDWTENIIGSKGLPGVADTILQLCRERNANVGTLCITGRDVEEQEYTLEHGVNWEWRLVEERDESELTDEQQKVMEVLAKYEPATASELKHHSRVLQNMDSLHEGRTDEILEELRTLGKAERVIETGVGNHGAVRYRIKRPPSTIDVDSRPVDVATRPVISGIHAPSCNAPTGGVPSTGISQKPETSGIADYLAIMRVASVPQNSDRTDTPA